VYKFIEIKGAREHNLKNISLRIPKNQLLALTGPSGGGSKGGNLVAEGSPFEIMQNPNSHTGRFLKFSNSI
jgi:excinuclease UvrABC ATPase subunit